MDEHIPEGEHPVQPPFWPSRRNMVIEAFSKLVLPLAAERRRRAVPHLLQPALDLFEVRSQNVLRKRGDTNNGSSQAIECAG
jgi:hypothetical protein